MLETIKEWDREFFVFLNGLGVERLDGFWVFVTRTPNWIPLFIFFGALIFYYYRGKKASAILFFLILTVGFTLLITSVVKEYVARLRPSDVEAWGDLIRVLQQPSNYSFFSGHASSSFAITTFVVLSLRNYTKWIYISYLWPLLFVLSRIFVGVHYPSDIIAGAMVGTFIAVIGHKVCQNLLNKHRLFQNP